MAIFKWISFALLLLCYEVAAESSTTLVPDISGKPCRNTEKIQYLSSSHYNGYCYWFTKYVPATWQGASAACNNTSSMLASVHSMSELNFLKNMVSAERRHHIFWIGMQEGIDSVFRWEDGTPVDFVLWDNDDRNYARIVGTCAYLNPVTGHFGSKRCSESHLFICKTKDAPYDWLVTEPGIRSTGVNSITRLITSAPLDISTPVINTSVLPEICPDEWHIFGDKCYGMFGLRAQDKQTWTNADNECVELGATMISIHSQKEQDFVTMMMSGKTDGAWIGFYEDPSEKDRAFHWADGSPVDYTNWDINQPNNWDGRKEECANMRFGLPHFGRWNDAECEKLQHSYICQIHIDPKKANFVQDTDHCAEPEGWIKLNSTCYRIFNETANHVTWLQALSRCNKFGGNLVTVKNLRDTIFLRFHLTELQDVFWIGMRNEEVHKRYSWITGPAHYSNWDRGQPLEILNKPNCVATNSKGRWIVRDCYETHPFICEVNEGDSGAVTEATQDPGVGMVCPSGSLKWTDYGGSGACYIIELTEQVTWYEATYRCFREGGSLASFHSIEEVNTILKQITDYANPLYVGLGQKHDGGFGWMDNSAVDFSNWEPGQPSSQSQLCVEMLSRSGTWNDISCELKRGYICSVAKVSSNDSIAALMANKWSSSNQDEGGIGAGIIIAIVLGIMITIAALVATYCYLYPPMKSVSRFTELENADL